MESQAERRPEGHIDQAVRAFSGTEFPEEFRQIASQTVLRMRNLLHRGELTAYYFDNYGPHGVSREFWATAEADGVLELGVYWPFGKPSRVYESRPNYKLLIRQLDLGKLLSEAHAEKRPLPRSKMPALAEALRRLEDLPNRKAQLQVVRELPEFSAFKITMANFREAAKDLPRKPGRKSERESRR